MDCVFRSPLFCSGFLCGLVRFLWFGRVGYCMLFEVVLLSSERYLPWSVDLKRGITYHDIPTSARHSSSHLSTRPFISYYLHVARQYGKM